MQADNNYLLVSLPVSDAITLILPSEAKPGGLGG